MKPKIPRAETALTAQTNQLLMLSEVDAYGNPTHYRCTCCNKIKSAKKFWTSHSPSAYNGHCSICDDCCRMMALNSKGKFDKERTYELCRILDLMFVNKTFDFVNNCEGKKQWEEKAKVGVFIRYTNSPDYISHGKGFKDSEPIINTNQKEEEQEEPQPEVIEPDRIDGDAEDISLWGEGWSIDEYSLLNDMYKEYQKNYALKTAMHKMALIKICKLQLRYDCAIAQNNTNDAKYWGDLLSKAQSEAKFNPSQLSTADLTDGITSFSQLAAVLEKSQDIIPLLPEYTERPHDKVDYTIWQYINCARHLDGKPTVPYSEIYKFLSDRDKEFSNKYKFAKVDEDGHYDEDDWGE